MEGKFVSRIATEHTGGNCMADVVYLRNGKLVVLSDEAMFVFDNPRDWTGEGEIENGRECAGCDGFVRGETPHAFIASIDTDEPDGPASTDLLTLHDGRVVGIDPDIVVLYPDRRSFDSITNEELGPVAQGAPAIELHA